MAHEDGLENTLDAQLDDAATELRAAGCEGLALAVETARNRLAAPDSGTRITEAALAVAECKEDGDDGPCGACLEDLDAALGIGQ